ncbi:MAG: nucleotidyl transferase AbiEii/AbiGii toxin family protein [Hyphomicrobium sp.]
MVLLGRANSRMKDFYDIRVLSGSREFTGDELARAIRATFDRRQTPLPSEAPDCLTPAFADDAAKQQQWTSFIADVSVQPGSLAGVVRDLAEFLMPHARTARDYEAN